MDSSIVCCNCRHGSSLDGWQGKENYETPNSPGLKSPALDIALVMPIYEFHCEKCEKESEILVRSADWKGVGMPSLRLEEAVQEVFHICIGGRSASASAHQDKRRRRTLLRRRRMRLSLNRSAVTRISTQSAFIFANQ